MIRKLSAEFLGTAWLVLGGCGSAVLAAGVPDLGIGYAGVALAFGLTVVTMAYAIGHVSGCHLNPGRSTSQALFVGGWPLQQLWLFWVAPVAGAVLAGITHRWLAARD